MTNYINSVLMTLLLIMPFFFGLYLKRKKLLNKDSVCYLIILSGIILRLIYISYTGINVRQHDVHDFFENNGGHSEYILYLYDNHALPDFDPRNIWQFYHPPLHHIICALWLNVINKLGMDITTTGVNSLQFLTTGYSVLFCIFAYKTFRRLGLKPTTLALCTAAVTFHPTLILLSGSVNNDMLAALLGMMAIYYTVKWSQDKKWYSIVMIALSVGFGMLSKLTVGLLAPAVAAVFLVILIKNIKEWKRLIPQFAVFGVICMPLGLCWSVRNYMRFGVPLNYVPKVSDDSGQFIAVSAFKRLVDFRLFQLASPFTQWEWNGDPYNEYNPIIALLKNAMFDESTFFQRSVTLQSFCTALFFCNIVISVLAVIAVVMLWVKNKNTALEHKLLITLTAAVIFGNYMVFCINYPHVCTENMRYCVPLIFTSAAVTGLLADREDMKDSRVYKLFRSVFVKGTAAFCLLSGFVYTSMMYYEIWVKV